MLGRFFNRYTALAIVAQVIAIVETWVMAFAVSPFGDRLFGLMLYCYFPFGYVAIVILKYPVMSYWTRRGRQARKR
jgi:hypothetical protein